MIGYRRGDVVLITFLFADEVGGKRRPALVISSAAYHRARQDIVVAAISSNVSRGLYGDYVIVDWQAAGLSIPSAVTGIIRTAKRTMIHRKLGVMTDGDLQAYDAELRRSLGL